MLTEMIITIYSNAEDRDYKKRLEVSACNWRQDKADSGEV